MEPSAKQWEYRSIMIDVAQGIFSKAGVIDEARLIAELNTLGEQGWELVVGFDTNIQGGRSEKAVLLLKRPR